MWCRRKRIIGCMDRFHEIHCSGRRLTRKQTTSRPDNVWPDMWKHDWLQRNAKKRKSGPSRNPNSTQPEECVVFTSLILMMRNSRISWKMLVEEIWKFRCQQQCLVKLHKIRLYCWSWRTYENPNGSSYSQISWRSHCRKRHEFIESLQSRAQIYSLPDAKAAVENNGKHWTKHHHWIWRKSKTIRK